MLTDPFLLGPQRTQDGWPTCLGLGSIWSPQAMKSHAQFIPRPRKAKRLPYLSIASLLHTAEEQTGCPSGLLKQTEAVPTPAMGWWLSDSQEGSQIWYVDFPLFPKVYLKCTHSLCFPSVVSSSCFEAHLEECFLWETQQFTQAQLSAWSSPSHAEFPHTSLVQQWLFVLCLSFCALAPA